MKGEAETRASRFDIKKVCETKLSEDFSPTLIFNGIVFTGISRGRVLVFEPDWSRFIDEFIPSFSFFLVGVHTRREIGRRVKVNVFRKSGPNGGNFESGGHDGGGLFRVVWNNALSSFFGVLLLDVLRFFFFFMDFIEGWIMDRNEILVYS